MSTLIKLDNVAVTLAESFSEQSAFFKHNIAKINHNDDIVIDSIIVVSSSDLCFLTSEYSQKIVSQVLKSFPNTKADIVCQGCLGLYTAALHFLSNPSSRSALVIMIESPQEILQVGLNTTDLGNLKDQDGMLGKPGVGLCRLERTTRDVLTPNDVVIDFVEIIARTTTLDANAIFVKRIIKRVIALQTQQQSEIISFEIGAKLAQVFKKYIQPSLANAGFDQTWLPSFEQDQHHVFSLKLLHEVLEYQHKLNDCPIIALGLGVGGRFGVMRFTTKKFLADVNYPEPVSFDMPLIEHYATDLKALSNQANEKDYYETGKKEMMTINPSPSHLRDNLYFRWPLTLEALEQLTPMRAPAMSSIVREEASEDLALTD